MEDNKQKYVRLKDNDSIIIFPCIIMHSDFKYMDPISAGFCYVDPRRRRVDCFGESISLRLKSDPKEDSLAATRQVFGIDDFLNMLE